MVIDMGGVLANGAAPNKGVQTFFWMWNEGDTFSYGMKSVLDAIAQSIRNLSDGKAGGFSTYIAHDQDNRDAQMANQMMNDFSNFKPGQLRNHDAFRDGFNNGAFNDTDMANVMDMFRNGRLGAAPPP